MFRVKNWKELAFLASIAGGYFIAGKFFLQLATVHVSASPFWPVTGLTLAAFLILGTRIWPGIALGAFLVNITTAGSIATSIGIATGNTLEGILGCYLVTQFAKGRQAFERAPDIFRFTFLAALLSTTFSATFGVTCLALGGYATWASYGVIWRTWWLGDAIGSLVVTPLILIWYTNPRIEWKLNRLFHAGLLFSTEAAIGWIVFGGPLHAQLKNYPVEFLCIPFLIWTAFAFGRREAATAVVALAAIAVWGTVDGYGPFIRGTRDTSFLLLQIFMGVMALMTLALGAEVSKRKQAEEQVQRLAVTDPLTGLANYRRLLEAIDAEIKRYGRTERPFAVLLLDLDGLKKINDSYGHLVGSQALCRLATVLRIHCRETDVPARYGGDEFAVVMPETSAADAWKAARRISERLAKDGELPPISVSVGAAVYPHDGGTISQLLAEADRALYREKPHPNDRALLQS